METSMSNGVSALLSFQKALEVESNNTGNLQTTAFKSDGISFADMFYDNRVGNGVQTNVPQKDFSQGQLIQTNSEYDFAIQGEGFFMLQDPDQLENIHYTRAGQFKSDKDNNLVDPNGMLVMGVKPIVTGDMITANHTNSVATMVIETEESTVSINTYISDYEDTTYETGAIGESGSNYKTEGANNTDIEELLYEYNNALKAYSIDPVEGEDASKARSSVTFPISSNLQNNEYTVEVIVDGVKFQQNFDESIENTLKLLSDKINELSGITSSINTDTGELTIESMIPGKNMVVSQAKVNEENLFITDLVQESGSGQKLIDAIYGELEALIERINSSLAEKNSALDEEERLSDEALADLQIKLATNRSEIFNLESGAITDFEAIVLDLNALGMNSTLYEKLIDGDITTVAAYPGIESEDGKIYLTDGDARFLVGMLSPVTFNDKSILNPEGDNLYTNSDGDVLPYYIEDAARVYGRYLENSNVDLSKELVNLLTFQKAFEANSKSITTSDELIKTALDLKTK